MNRSVNLHSLSSFMVEESLRDSPEACKEPGEETSQHWRREAGLGRSREREPESLCLERLRTRLREMSHGEIELFHCVMGV